MNFRLDRISVSLVHRLVFHAAVIVRHVLTTTNIGRRIVFVKCFLHKATKLAARMLSVHTIWVLLIAA